MIHAVICSALASASCPQSLPPRPGQREALCSLHSFLGGAGLAHAQLTTADILGTVTDATGAVVPNAQVTIKNLATGETRTGATSASGEYTFSLLQPGHYSITVTAGGFKVSNTPRPGD